MLRKCRNSHSRKVAGVDSAVSHIVEVLAMPEHRRAGGFVGGGKEMRSSPSLRVREPDAG